jgi:hypothetical protein
LIATPPALATAIETGCTILAAWLPSKPQELQMTTPSDDVGEAAA